MEDLKGQNKGQKLASAIYLVTSFFDDKEPLRWRLRALSADLISESVKDKFAIYKEITSLFSLAKTGGLVSETNYQIIIHELTKISQESEKRFDLRFLLDTTKEERSLREPEKPASIKDKNIERGLSYVSTSKLLETGERQSKPLKAFGAVSVKKNSRQSTIIGLLKRKKEIMIKDVTPLISDCSEKTIQRELLAMVSLGILKKIGEKRWSRYSLA